MRTFSMVVWSLLVVMMMGFTSCGDDDNDFTPEQKVYIQKNLEYVWAKKAEKNDAGELAYKQVLLGGDTALYRIIKKENNYTSVPTMSSTITVKDMEGKLIDGTVFQPKTATATFPMGGLIPGFSAILLNVRLDETVEMIIPSNLGYGSMGRDGIPGGSTLVFTLTLDKIK